MKGFTALVIEIDGMYPKKKMIDAIRTYYILAGRGFFTIDGHLNSAGPGDFFVIEPGQIYQYEGEMKLLEYNISPTNSFKEKKL